MTEPRPEPVPPGEGLLITLKTPPLPVSWARLAPPVITVNGWPVPTPNKGRNIVPAAPGRYLVPSQMGPAEHDAEVVAGQWTDLEYKPPLWTLGRGSLGPPPQRYNGLVPIALVLAVSMIVGVLTLAIIL